MMMMVVMMMMIELVDILHYGAVYLFKDEDSPPHRVHHSPRQAAPSSWGRPCLVDLQNIATLFQSM